MKLACPSWVIPGSWGENLDFILSQVERPVNGVELLVFDFDAKTRAALAAELPTIARAASQLELSIHLPSRVGPGTLELVDMMKDFAKVFVVHPPKRGDEGDFAGFLRAAADDALRGQLFAIEYTNEGDFARGFGLLDESGIPSSNFPICMDTGHLLIEGRDPADFARWAGERLARVHLHDIVCKAAPSGGADSFPVRSGTADSVGTMRDHAPLKGGSAWLGRLFPILEAFAGTVELELFDWEAVLASARLLSSMETMSADQATDPKRVIEGRKPR